MPQFLQYLSKHSIIGMASAAGASIIQYISEIELYIKIFGFVAGIIIALLTIYAKILEIKNLKNK